VKSHSSSLPATILALVFLSGCASTSSPLVTASRSGNEAEVRALLNKGANVNEPGGEYGRTPLMAASIAGHLGIVKELLRTGADVNARDNYNDSALTLAAQRCHLTVVQVLIESRADVNTQNTGFGSTPLMLAAECNDPALAKAMLAAGVKTNVKNKVGANALHAAARKGNLEAVKALADAGEAIDEPWGSRTALSIATERGDEPMVDFLIERGANVNANSGKGLTPVMGAAYYGRTSCVSLLVKAGGDVNASDPEGLTPLMFAAKLGHTETARLLVSLGANVNATSKNGKTPLAYALEGGHAEVVVVLRRAGAQPQK
jgi:uncharacterized protein